MATAQKDVPVTAVFVLITGIATTVALWVSLADPINIPKMLILSLFSAGLLGSVIPQFLVKPRRRLSLGQAAAMLFAFGILITAVFSDEHYTAFYGASGRSNGAFSYIALAATSFVAMQSFGSRQISNLRNVLVSIGAFLASYGYLQTTGRDPIKWNLLYNPIVGTLGNPDFVSAVLGICAIATLWWIIDDHRLGARIFGVALILFELYIIRRSASMQGLLIVGLGFAILIVATLWSWKKSVGFAGAAAALISSLPVLLALFNKGPFAAHIYRGSIQSRIDYWHAAVSMFKAHPVLGVGLDRVGDNYWQYAPQVQVAFNQGTDNVHNVFLQFLATGGLVVFLPYILLVGVILITSIRAITASSGKVRFELIGLFSMWISLLVISSISIDTLGVSVWFWISGGALYSLSNRTDLASRASDVQKKKSRPAKTSQKNLEKGVSSNITRTSVTILVILAFLLVSPAWRTSLAIQDLVRNSNRLDKDHFTAKLKDVSKIWPKNPQTLVSLSDLSLRISDPVLANQFATEAVRLDPRSFNANSLNAIALETELKFHEAIPYRVAILKFNNWDTRNMLRLVTDYVKIGENDKAKRLTLNILRIDPTGVDATAAQELLKG